MTAGFAGEHGILESEFGGKGDIIVLTVKGAVMRM